MNNYTVVIHRRVYGQISEIQDFIASIHTYSAAEKYSKQLFDEIESLSYLADAMQYTQWKVAKQFHPHAKRLITKNRKWNVIFHIEDAFVIVDSIIASSQMR